MNELWQSFAAAVLPPDAPPDQVREMRRAFYGGAWAVLTEVEAAAATRTADEERRAVEYLERLKADCRDFAGRVEGGVP